MTKKTNRLENAVQQHSKIRQIFYGLRIYEKTFRKKINLHPMLYLGFSLAYVIHTLIFYNPRFPIQSALIVIFSTVFFVLDVYCIIYIATAIKTIVKRFSRHTIS